MIPKKFPCYILSFTGARIIRYCLWYGVSHIMVSSPMFLIDQDTAAPVFSHLHPDGNSLSTTNTHEAFYAHLSSLLEAETTQPRQCWYPDVCQSCWGAGSWWDSCSDVFRGTLLHTHFHLPLSITRSEPASPNSPWTPGWAQGVHGTEHSGWGKWAVSTLLNVEAPKSR